MQKSTRAPSTGFPSAEGQHRAGGGGVEPAQVQHGLRLAGAQEPPLSVGPGFHPGVVAFRMGPTRGINLTGRNPHAAEGGHAEGRFLAAAAQAVLDRGQGRVRTPVGRLVGHFLVAPVVHFQDGLLHRHPLHAGLQLVIEDQPRGIEILVVGPQGQHEMAELPLGNVPAHLLARLQGLAHVRQEEFRRIVGDIGQRHIGVQEFEGFLLFRRQGQAGGREMPARRLHPGLVVFVHRGAVRGIGQKMGTAAGRHKERHQQRKGEDLFHIGMIDGQIYEKAGPFSRPG